jgi:chromate transporter
MSDSQARPGLAALFMGFFTIGVCGFGGVLPWARRMVVEQRRWMTAAEFADLVGICQFLPGGNVINLSVAVGARFAGARGAVAAFAGLTASPMAIVIGLGGLYDRYSDLPIVRHGMAGLAATVSALVLATALKIASPLRSRPIGIVVALATFLAVAALRWPLPPVLLAAAPLSMLLAWRFRS